MQVEQIGDFWDEDFVYDMPNSPNSYTVALYFLLVTMSTIGTPRTSSRLSQRALNQSVGSILLIL